MVVSSITTWGRMSYYVIRNKYSVPGFLFSALASWMIALPVMTIVTLTLAAIPGASHSDLLAGLPWPISALLFACYGYAMIGAFCIYMTCRFTGPQSSGLRWSFVLGGFLALTFGLILGSFIYALVVWKKDTRKVDGPQHLS